MHLELPTDGAMLTAAAAIGEQAARDVARLQLSQLQQSGRLPEEADDETRRLLIKQSSRALVVAANPGSIELVLAILGLLPICIEGAKPFLAAYLIDSGYLAEAGRLRRDRLKQARRSIFMAAKRRGLEAEFLGERAGDAPEPPPRPPSDPSSKHAGVRIAEDVAGELDVKLRRVRIAPNVSDDVDAEVAAVGEDLRRREKRRNLP